MILEVQKRRGAAPKGSPFTGSLSHALWLAWHGVFGEYSVKWMSERKLILKSEQGVARREAASPAFETYEDEHGKQAVEFPGEGPEGGGEEAVAVISPNTGKRETSRTEHMAYEDNSKWVVRLVISV